MLHPLEHQGPGMSSIDVTRFVLQPVLPCCRRGSRAMRRDYKLHDWFREDLMRHAGKHRRPPHRQVGPRPSPASSHFAC